MRIKFLEIANFRKLRAVRIDVAEETTLFVGANNSGKTSAMDALGHFLVDQKRFSTHDFSASQWPGINEIGKRLISDAESAPNAEDWGEVVLALDVWLHVEDGEFHRVSKLIPTLAWSGGLLGVRLRFEPKGLEALQREYRAAAGNANEVRAKAGANTEEGPEKVWPGSMMEFLERKLAKHFAIGSYLLDRAKLEAPERGQARPQRLPEDAEPIATKPFNGLISIDEINAQRGFGDESDRGDAAEDGGRVQGHRLSRQLHTYYARHLDPNRNPVASDKVALRAIEMAQDAFDERLRDAFEVALIEVEELGYPGVADPKLKISTRIRPMDGLNHDAAVQYELSATKGGGGISPLLPEHYNGLGYQNLISMIFRLMGFRDHWMRVGKASEPADEDDASVEPLHLVLVEEPEAHLHAQVQQVFIRKAYDVLRKHPNLEKDGTHTTQLLVSTHSSHVAHELPYASLRYFQRRPASGGTTVPFSAVVNLSSVFGEEDETARFVTRYLQARHCDLFFADAVILVEGAAERMLVPHFMRRAEHSYLTQCYITLLEIGGSHAFRLRPLIDALGLLTLVVTDLDAADGSTRKAVRAVRGAKQITTNSTLKKWHPQMTSIDDLLSAASEAKVLADPDDPQFAVRVAYPSPTRIGEDPDAAIEVLPYTFEDALAFANLDVFADDKLEGGHLLGRIRKAIDEYRKQNTDLNQALFEVLRKGGKAEFALDVLAGASSDQLRDLMPPAYIAEGLAWLEERLKQCPTGESSEGGT